jgi:hypothetical protein
MITYIRYGRLGSEMATSSSVNALSFACFPSQVDCALHSCISRCFFFLSEPCNLAKTNPQAISTGDVRKEIELLYQDCRANYRRRGEYGGVYVFLLQRDHGCIQQGWRQSHGGGVPCAVYGKCTHRHNVRNSNGRWRKGTCGNYKSCGLCPILAGFAKTLVQAAILGVNGSTPAAESTNGLS